MNIIIVTEYFPVSDQVEITGGVETRAFEAARHLATSHNVTILTSRPHGSQRESVFSVGAIGFPKGFLDSSRQSGKSGQGFRVIRCGKEIKYANKGSFLERLSFVQDAIRAGKSLKADLVDGYNFTTYYPAYRIARSHRIPAFATYHDVWLGEWIKNVGFVSGLIGEIVERFLLSGRGRRFSKFITNSAYTKGKLVKVGVPAHKILPIYSGLDLEQFRSVPTKKSKHPSLYPRVIAIGRLVEYKRMDDLIRAIAHVAVEIPDIECRILGVGPDEPRLRRLMQELNMEDHVHLISEIVKREDTIRLLKSSSIFCLPSLVEGMGLVTIEALAAGLPFVNSAIPATIEITKNGKGGLLFEPGNWKELAEQLVILLTNKKEYDRCICEHEDLLKEFSLELMCKRIEQVYMSVV